MKYCDIHCHILAGVDDGPSSDGQMYAMLDAMYSDGTRVLCVTPHYHPGYFGHNTDAAEDAFSRLSEYAENKYPDMRLLRGNELRYAPGCLSWLADGMCRTLNGTDYLLVDFSQDESARNITGALERLLSAGYTPVLAHAERYSKLSFTLKELEEYRANGVYIQVDVRSLFRDYGRGAQCRANRILKRGLADVVASDAHDMKSRIPGLTDGFGLIKKKYGTDYAEHLFYKNPLSIVGAD